MDTSVDKAGQLKELYRQRFAEGASYRRELWEVLCEDFFQQYVDATSTVLDMGCGWGEFINAIRAETRYGMDLNPDSAAHLDDGVKLLAQDCSQEWPIADDALDVVLTSNFLEHLPTKAHVERTIKQVRRCLKPGGILICLGPNIRHLSGEYWDFWDHHVMISDRSLSELLRMNEFVVERCHGRFLPYTMSDGNHPNLLLVKLYLRIPMAWRVMGKQFLVIARNGP